MIKKGSLVKWVTACELSDKDRDIIGLVLTNPKEEAFAMAPRITAIKMVVDVLFGSNIFKVRVENLEKVKK